jgi:3-oxoadipyl-CoA thiolase
MNDALICDAVRTPFGRYGGVLSAVRADDLAAITLRALMERNPGLEPAKIDDVILGCANQAGEDNRNVARMAVLLAGLPDSVPGTTLNRLCGSGLDAVAMAARTLRSGEAEIMIAGGVESMTRAPFVMGKSEGAFGRAHKLEDTTLGWRFVNPAMKAAYGLDTMPETAEHVAAQYGISRTDQDYFALRSQQRAAIALRKGILAEEIVTVAIPQKNGVPCVVTVDEHPRPETTLDGLAALKPVVRSGGTVTAGNAAGINDGAGALLLATADGASRQGLKPIGRVVATAVAGVPPRIMGMGPVPATRKVLSMTGLSLDDMDVIELNEAFAAQAVAVLRELGLRDDAEHVNPNGGAIALGHPLGASGARLLNNALRQLQRTGGRYGLCTMCIGVGQGIATIVERV